MNIENKDRYDGLYAYRPETLFALLEGETPRILGEGRGWRYWGTWDSNLDSRSLWLPIEYMK